MKRHSFWVLFSMLTLIAICFVACGTNETPDSQIPQSRVPDGIGDPAGDSDTDKNNDEETNMNESNHSNSTNTLEKGLYCQYDPSVNFESAVGGLKIFVPTSIGYINYHLVHSVNIERNCDTWRLSKAYAVDDRFENAYELTPKGAEWDMALRLDGRSDFIGGFAHGDEIYTSFCVEINGTILRVEDLTTLTPFDEMRITVQSIGYDPSSPSVAALTHQKEYSINTDGILLNQRVEWLNDYTLGSSYMAMMPPLKDLTDRVYTDVTPTPKVASKNYGYTSGASEAVVYGTSSGIRFEMSVPQYPSFPGGNKFLLTDNSGGHYNKMYFVICNGATVSKGDVWETTTKYAISNGS